MNTEKCECKQAFSSCCDELVVTASCSVCQEAHEQGINAVRFSSGSDLLATGGTDRVIKLWEVRAGTSWTIIIVIVVNVCDEEL